MKRPVEHQNLFTNQKLIQKYIKLIKYIMAINTHLKKLNMFWRILFDGRNLNQELNLFKRY